LLLNIIYLSHIFRRKQSIERNRMKGGEIG